MGFQRKTSTAGSPSPWDLTAWLSQRQSPGSAGLGRDGETPVRRYTLPAARGVRATDLCSGYSQHHHPSHERGSKTSCLVFLPQRQQNGTYDEHGPAEASSCALGDPQTQDGQQHPAAPFSSSPPFPRPPGHRMQPWPNWISSFLRV